MLTRAIKLLIASSFIFAGHLQAAPMPDHDMVDAERDLGFEKASQLCTNLTMISDKEECRQVLSGASFVDAQAIALCGLRPFASDQIRCLGVVSNKNYTAAHIAVCKSKEISSEQIQCLADNGISKEKDQSAGLKAASSLCNSLSFQNDKTKCKQILTTAPYLSKEAVHSCRSIDFEGVRVECLGVIANKRFAKDEVANCMKTDFESSKISCLKEAGTTL